MLNNNGSGSLMKPYILSTSTVSIVHKRKSVPHSPPHRRCGTKLPVDFCSPNFARPHDPGAERPRVFCRQAVASALTPCSSIVSKQTGTADAHIQATGAPWCDQTAADEPNSFYHGGGTAAANELPAAASLAAPGPERPRSSWREDRSPFKYQHKIPSTAEQLTGFQSISTK